MSSEPMKSGDVYADNQQWAGGRATGGVLIGDDQDRYSLWHAGRHAQYIAGTPWVSHGEATEHVRLATAEERDDILASLFDLPLFPGASDAETAAFERYIRPQLEDLLERVPYEACPGCHMLVPSNSSDAQVRHMDEHHPEIVEERRREAGIHPRPGQQVTRRSDLMNYPPR